jgi:Skp family chaperone for outer membrane proteins
MLFRLLPILLLLAAGAHAGTPVAPRLATVDLTAVFEAHPRTATETATLTAARKAAREGVRSA